MARGSDDLRPGRAGIQVMLRLPEALRDRIVAASERAGRSVNAEIVASLVESYPETSASFEAVVDGVLGLLESGRGVRGEDGSEGVEPDDVVRLLERVRDEVERRRG